MDPRLTAALEEEKMPFMFCSEFSNNHDLSLHMYVTRTGVSENLAVRLRIYSHAFAPFPAVPGICLVTNESEIADVSALT